MTAAGPPWRQPSLRALWAKNGSVAAPRKLYTPSVDQTGYPRLSGRCCLGHCDIQHLQTYHQSAPQQGGCAQANGKHRACLIRLGLRKVTANLCQNPRMILCCFTIRWKDRKKRKETKMQWKLIPNSPSTENVGDAFLRSRKPLWHTQLQLKRKGPSSSH